MELSLVFKKDIISYLNQLSEEVATNNILGLYDINKKSELIVAKLLNYLFDYQLEDAKNNPFYPAIDLVDPKNKIGVQVTSTISDQKIKGTCMKFIKYKQYNTVQRLILYFISRKPIYFSKNLRANVNQILGNHLKFDFENDLMSNVTVIKYVEALTDINVLYNIQSALAEDIVISNEGRKYPDSGRVWPKRLNNFAGISLQDLVGREELLLSIHDNFEKFNITLITGLGGIGKTSVAKAYLEKYKEEYYHLAYVDVTKSIAESILQRLASIDNSFEYNSNLSVLQNLDNLIEKIKVIENVVLILDNCNDDIELLTIKPILESLEWKILITTRTRPSTYKRETIEAQSLQPKDAFVLFNKYFEFKNQDDKHLIDKILKAINYHTKLTILLAKAATNSPLLGLSELADKVTENAFQNESLNILVDIDEQNKTVYEFMLMLFKPEELDGYQKLYMRFFSILPSQEIPISHLFELFENEHDQAYLIRTLNKLTSKGWIEKYSNNFFRIHPLVRLVTQRKLAPNSIDCHKLIQNLNTLLGGSIDLFSLNIYLPYAESIVEYFSSSTDSIIALLLNRMSSIYLSLANYSKAIDSNFLALKILNSLDPPYYEAEAQSYGYLMHTFREIGDFENANKYGIMCLKIQEQKLHQLHPDLAATYSDMAMVARGLKQLKIAFDYLINSIAIFKWIYFNEYNKHSAYNLMLSYGKLAILISDMAMIGNNKKEDYKKAILTNYKALIIAKKLLQSEHTQLSELYNNISIGFRELNCFEKSLEYLEKALKIKEKKYLDGHPVLARSYYNMGMLHEKMELTNDAISYATKAYDMQIAHLSESHIDVIETKRLLDRLINKSH